MPERIPCINPRCRRTFANDGRSGEIVCGKCFRCLPVAVRGEHRRLWREIRKWERRIMRTVDEIQASRMRGIRDRLVDHLNRHWNSDIITFFLAPEKPEGLDGFLEEVGLR